MMQYFMIFVMGTAPSSESHVKSCTVIINKLFKHTVAPLTWTTNFSHSSAHDINLLSWDFFAAVK